MALLSSADGKQIDCMAIRACATCASDVTSPWLCIATGEISLDAKDCKRKFRFFLGRRGAKDPATHPSEKNESRCRLMGDSSQAHELRDWKRAGKRRRDLRRVSGGLCGRFGPQTKLDRSFGGRNQRDSQCQVSHAPFFMPGHVVQADWWEKPPSRQATRARRPACRHGRVRSAHP